MRKRKNGEGSYGTKNIKGVPYVYFRDADGNYTYARTQKELREKIKKNEEVKKSIEYNGNGDNRDAILSEYCYAWLKTKRRDLTGRAYDDYETVIRTRIEPYFIGRTEISTITVQMINDYLDELAEKYSRGSIDKVWTVLRQVFRHAMGEGDMPKLNMEKIRKPKESEVAVKKKEIPFISAADMDLLWEESKKKRYGDGAKVLAFIMYTGLRLSEATALTWDNVSSDFSEIKVVEANTRIVERDRNGMALRNKNGTLKYKSVTKDTKSAAGNRTIPCSNKACEILEYFASIRDENSKFVFITKNKKPFGKRALERTLVSMLNNSNCSRKDYTPHCLRHGFGSVLISKGVDIKIVSKLLGHSKISTTYDIYIGVYKEDEISAIKNVFG